jgi:hypothetical protein
MRPGSGITDVLLLDNLPLFTMSGIPTLTILSDEQKFNRDNLLKWSTNMTQLLGSKGLLGYIDGRVTKPPEPALVLPPPTLPLFTPPLRTMMSGVFATSSLEDILH